MTLDHDRSHGSEVRYTDDARAPCPDDLPPNMSATQYMHEGHGNQVLKCTVGEQYTWIT